VPSLFSSVVASVDQMIDANIPPIGNAGTETKKPIEQGSNNGN